MAKTGTIFLHGGSATTPDLIKAFIEAAGGPEKPLVVLAQASTDPDQKGRLAADWLRQNGAKVVNAPGFVRPDAAGIEVLTALLSRASGVWFPGGEAIRWMKAFKGTPVITAVREVYEKGGAIGGTSAGASLMGKWMPSGETDHPQMTMGAVPTTTAAGLLPLAIIDSQFYARERVQRLVNMVSCHSDCTGIGLDEGAWATVEKKRITLHTGQVMLIRAMSPTTRDPQNRLGAKEIRLQMLLPGESVSLS